MRFRNHLLQILLVAPALIALLPARALAGQSTDEVTTRTGALAAERDAKSSTVTAPERSFLEQKLYWYDNQALLDKVFGGWHGIHLAGGDFPAGAGTKFGVGYDHTIAKSPNAPNRIDLSTRAARSTRGYSRFAGSVSVRQVTGAPIDITVGATRYEFPEEDFFGFGRESARSDRSDYLMKGADVGADVRWKPRSTLEFTAGVWRLSPETTTGTDPRFPSVEDVFDPAALPAFGQQANFLRTDAGAAVDLRDNPLHPHAGGRYAVRLASYQDQDANAFDFRRVEIALHQYVPLPNRYRTLALRAEAVFTQPNSGSDVPFFYQPTLGGSQALRGFREFRFRDRHSVLVSAEYRWEAWWALDGAFFVDVGEVASSRRDFSLGALETSYGVGFRIHSNRAFISRLDLAFSREGFIPLLRFEHAF